MSLIRLPNGYPPIFKLPCYCYSFENWTLIAFICHYCDVIMDAIAFQITSLTIVYLTIYSGANQRKDQRSAPLAFVWGIHRWPMNSPHKWSVTRKMVPFDDFIMRVPDLKLSCSYLTKKKGTRIAVPTMAAMWLVQYYEKFGLRNERMPCSLSITPYITMTS